MIKVRSWELMLIKLVGLPILKRISKLLTNKAMKTDSEFDDALLGAFDVVIGFLESEGVFEET